MFVLDKHVYLVFLHQREFFARFCCRPLWLGRIDLWSSTCQQKHPSHCRTDSCAATRNIDSSSSLCTFEKLCCLCTKWRTGGGGKDTGWVRSPRRGIFATDTLCDFDHSLGRLSNVISGPFSDCGVCGAADVCCGDWCSMTSGLCDCDLIEGLDSCTR